MKVKNLFRSPEVKYERGQSHLRVTVVCEYCFCPQAILFMSLASGKLSLRVSPLNKRSMTVIEAIETFTVVSPYVFIFICSLSIFSAMKVTYELTECKNGGQQIILLSLR